MRKQTAATCIKPAVIFTACIHTIYAALLLGGSTWLILYLIIDTTLAGAGCRAQVAPMILFPTWIYSIILFSQGLRIFFRARKATLDLFVVNEFLLMQTLLMCFFVMLWCYSELSINFKILGIIRFSFDFFYVILLYMHLHELYCDKHLDTPKLKLSEEKLIKPEEKTLQI